MLWFIVGPSSPWCGVTVVAGTFALGPALAERVKRLVPPQWLHVLAAERVIHRIVVVTIFGWLLEAIGWSRLVAKPMRKFSGTKSGLGSLEQSLRGNVSAHWFCFAVHVLLAVLGLFSKAPGTAALWMLLPAVAVHLYPVLLQRSIMLRLQPLMKAIAEPNGEQESPFYSALKL